LNLHGSNPASTSTQGGAGPAEQHENGAFLGVEPVELLAAEARALLDAARLKEDVDRARIVAFARACLEISEAGRLALAVLDGGVFAPRRALELAAMVAAARASGERKASGEP
jgi:hypothetical protein